MTRTERWERCNDGIRDGGLLGHNYMQIYRSLLAKFVVKFLERYRCARYGVQVGGGKRWADDGHNGPYDKQWLISNEGIRDELWVEDLCRFFFSVFNVTVILLYAEFRLSSTPSR